MLASSESGSSAEGLLPVWLVALIADAAVGVGNGLDPHMIQISAKLLQLAVSIALYWTVRRLHRFELEHRPGAPRERRLHSMVCWCALSAVTLCAIQFCALLAETML